MKTRSHPARLALALVFALFADALGAEEAAGADVPPSVLKRYDKNKDGTLDEAERAAWEAAKAARREKARSVREELIEKYDADRDGRLSEEEHATARLEREKEKSAQMAEKMKERAEKQKAETPPPPAPVAEPPAESMMAP
jgi:hypothetical protein